MSGKLRTDPMCICGVKSYRPLDISSQQHCSRKPSSVLAVRALLRVVPMCHVGRERSVAQLPAWAGRGLLYSACLTVPAGPSMELATPWSMF